MQPVEQSHLAHGARLPMGQEIRQQTILMATALPPQIPKPQTAHA